MVWDPEQYARFALERRQPFYDLLAKVERAPNLRVVDLGCGTGVLTRELHQRLGAASTLGIDNSEAMLAKSAKYAGDGVSFEQADIAAVRGRRFDLVFSNAALHWLPDHPALFRQLTALVESGGQLAIQVPANWDHISSRMADEVARESPYRELLDGYTRGATVLDPRDYAEMLYELGYRERSVELKVYGHELPGVDAVVEWVKGALLTDFERRLSAEAFTAFVARYRERLLHQLGDPRPYFFTFKRILMWAHQGIRASAQQGESVRERGE